MKNKLSKLGIALSLAAIAALTTLATTLTAGVVIPPWMMHI